MVFLSDSDFESSARIKPFLGLASKWLSQRKTQRWIRRNKTTMIYIAIEQLLSFNDLLWVISRVPITIFNKIDR